MRSKRYSRFMNSLSPGCRKTVNRNLPNWISIFSFWSQTSGNKKLDPRKYNQDEIRWQIPSAKQRKVRVGARAIDQRAKIKNRIGAK
jgi:hypothetical protein